MSNLETRLKKLEQTSSNKKDHKTSVYIIGDNDDVDYWGNKIIHTVKPGDRVINITVDDEGDIY